MPPMVPTPLALSLPSAFVGLGYAWFVEITIRNNTDSTLKFQNAAYSSGKFYTDRQKDNDILPADLNKTIIPAHSDYVFGACGLERYHTGCLGVFDLIAENSMRALHISYWSPPSDIPYFIVSAPSLDSGWIVSTAGVNLTPGGPLGYVDVSIDYIGQRMPSKLPTGFWVKH